MTRGILGLGGLALNESPSEKEGKFSTAVSAFGTLIGPSMKVPPKRKGNDVFLCCRSPCEYPSMKVPPKRKGNPETNFGTFSDETALNESPSEKEGKCWRLENPAAGFLVPQ